MVTDENYAVVFINGWVLIDAIIVTLILMEMLLVFIYQIYCKSWNVSYEIETFLESSTSSKPCVHGWIYQW